jgi:hypothetical protein
MDANESQRQFLNGYREGTVLAVEGALCRVSAGELTTDWIQLFAACAGESSDWLAPVLSTCWPAFGRKRSTTGLLL